MSSLDYLKGDLKIIEKFNIRSKEYETLFRQKGLIENKLYLLSKKRYIGGVMNKTELEIYLRNVYDQLNKFNDMYKKGIRHFD